MAISVIEWHDDTGEELVHRFPEAGSGEFRLGSQLVVMESQEAVFFRDGKALDAFGPGRHTLETANIPLLTSFLSLPFGGKSPFRAEVYFVSTKVFTSLKWGTPEPILFRDPELAMVRIRGFGTFAIRVTDASLLVNKLVGTQGIYEQHRVEEYFKRILLSRLTDVLGEVAKSIFDLPALYDELAAALKSRVSADFASYGLELVDFVVESFSLPEEVQKVIDERTGMAAVGDVGQYMRFKAAKAMEEAAAQPGGAAGAAAGLGAGAGLGVGMASMMAQAMQQQPSSAAAPPAATAPGTAAVACPECGKPSPAGSKFCAECGAKFPTKAFCVECGAEVPPGAKFCPGCGKKVG